MSLEEKLVENTAAIRDLIAAINAARTSGKEQKPQAPAAPARDRKEPEVQTNTEVTYDALEKAFSTFALKNFTAAETLLSQFGVKRLSHLKSKPEVFSRVLDAIAEAQQS